MRNQLNNQTFILIGITILVYFSYPLLSIANLPVLKGGFPSLFLYIFSGWLVFIILLSAVAGKKGGKTRHHE